MRKMNRIFATTALAASFAGSLMAAPAAQAKLLCATLNVASEDFLDTFTIESDAGIQLSGDPDAIFFPVANDATGFTAAISMT
jgi:hypothetical protein